MSTLDFHKPYYGRIIDLVLRSSETGHVHAYGKSPMHPIYQSVYTSRILKINLYDNADAKYAEFETKNSRYGAYGDDYENIKFFCTSADCEKMRDAAEIDIQFLDGEK